MCYDTQKPNDFKPKKHIDEELFAQIEAQLKANKVDTSGMRKFFDKMKDKNGVYKAT